MKKNKLEHPGTRFNTFGIVAATMAVIACGGAPVPSSTPDDEVTPQKESSDQVAPPADSTAQTDAVPAAAPEQAAASADSSAEPAGAESANSEKAADETADRQVSDPVPAENAADRASEDDAPAVSSDKPIAEQIKETKSEIAKTKKALTAAQKKAKAAEKKLRTAEANKKKADEKKQADASVLANAEEKQKMLQDQLKDAQRILGLAEDALKEMKAKEPKNFKEKKDVEDSISSQSTFVNQKKALVRKKTEALEKQDKTVAIAKSKAEKTGKKGDENQAAYDDAVKADTDAREALAAHEKQLETLTLKLSELESRKAAEKANPTPASK